MYKRKEYPIKSYVPMRTNKDRTCICCGDTIPAGSSRMIPRHAKANHGLCFPCFRKWRDTGGDLKLMNNPGDAKKEYVIHMSNILKGNCDIIKGRKLYVAFKKAINGGKKIVIKFDTDQPISMSTRVINLKLVDVPKGVKDLIVNYIENIVNYELQDIYIHDPDIQESRSYT